MPLATLRQVVEEAKKGHYAVGAFNVNNMEQVQAVVDAAAEVNAPVILQCSRGCLKYTQLAYLKHLILAAVELHPTIPIVVHLDHGDTLDTVKTAIGLGVFTSVMIDASHYPYEKNVAISAEVAEYAHPYGVSVEAELGTLGGIEEDIKNTVQLTDSDQAVDFVNKTKIDALAVAVGTSHGAYKFKATPVLATDLVGVISQKTGKPLVMHGSSSVPQEILAQVNKYGGKMPDAQGVPVPALQECITKGVTKINVDTDSRLAMTGAIRQVFHEKPEVFDLRDYLGPARTAIKNMVAQRIKDFGSAGHAQDYTVLTLDEAKKVYYGL